MVPVGTEGINKTPMHKQAGPEKALEIGEMLPGLPLVGGAIDAAGGESEFIAVRAEQIVRSKVGPIRQDADRRRTDVKAGGCGRVINDGAGWRRGGSGDGADAWVILCHGKVGKAEEQERDEEAHECGVLGSFQPDHGQGMGREGLAENVIYQAMSRLTCPWHARAGVVGGIDGTQRAGQAGELQQRFGRREAG